MVEWLNLFGFAASFRTPQYINDICSEIEIFQQKMLVENDPPEDM